MTGAIEVTDLTRVFGRTVAVDRVSFEVRRGEVFGFLGPNGAGKTTTVRMLTGVIRPDSGSARILGHDIVREPLQARQCVGVVPETTNAYVDLTAWQNLMLMGGLYGVPRPRAEERSRRLLEMLDLYDRRDQRVQGYSKGMRQRLILAMALLHEPGLIFLDEPTSGLDVQSTRRIHGMLRELNGNGTTIFLTTHNMEEANRLCHRVGIIDHGRIAAIDTPERLKRRIERLQYIEVIFDAAVDREALRALEGVSGAEPAGERWRIYTDDVDRAIRSLAAFSSARQARILSLETRGPTLDEVFLQLTAGGAP